MSGAAWEQTDLTRFMLYALKCSSTLITMEEVDAEAAEQTRGLADVSIDTDTLVEGRCIMSAVDVEERRRASEVACEMVRKAGVRKQADVRLRRPPLSSSSPAPAPPPPPPQSEAVGVVAGVVVALTSAESAEDRSSDDDMDDGKSGPSGACQNALPALDKKQGRKRRMRSCGESFVPQTNRGKGERSTGSVAAEGKRSTRMKTPKNLDW